MTNYTNLKRHRRSVVDMACDVLCDFMGLPHEFNATGDFDLFADFDGEALAQTCHPNAERDLILAQADTCDGINLYVVHQDEEGIYTATIRILWGNGVGNCISDYSAKLDDVPRDGIKTHISSLMDYVEFMEI